jgi:hypothetical protein
MCIFSGNGYQKPIIMASKASNNSSFTTAQIKKLVLFRIAPSVLVFLLTFFVTAAMLVGFFPDTFGPIFSGYLSLEERGAYADCSLAANRKNRLCGGVSRETKENREWSSLQKSKKPLPFNLH